MPVVTFSYEDFLSIFGYKMDKEEFIQKIPYIGCEIERVEGDEISIEVFPNRPDLCSVEGIARAARAFFGMELGIKKYKVKKSNVLTEVDPTVKEVRPYIATALVKDVKISDRAIKALMDLQEKLHYGLGRNRKKVAIGVHDFDAVKPPFVYKATFPKSIRFVPLASEEEMDLEEILKKHPKGVEYGHLLKGKQRFPIILDAEQNVLSFPPIINGSLTEVTTLTRNIFLEVTGTDREAVKTALNIVATALAERGGELHETMVKDGDKIYEYPDLTVREEEISIEHTSSTLGLRLSEEEIKLCLAKMGYDVLGKEDGRLKVGVPAWRADIMHEIDLIEDVAIGYGFDKFSPDKPKTLTFGKYLVKTRILENLRLLMIGLGFTEVLTFSLSNRRNEFERMGIEGREAVLIENPISEEYTCLRQNLLPSLLNVLRKNKHHPLPQQIFEIGYVVNNDAKNELRLAAAKIDAKANFSECKSIAESIFKGLGIEMKIKGADEPPFIEGRAARIIFNNDSLGVFGEIHPKTIQAFELEYPIIALEINIDALCNALTSARGF